MIFFLDIETATEYAELGHAPEATQKIWADKYHSRHKNDDALYVDDTYKSSAALYPEFSQVVCVSVTYTNHGHITTKSFTGPEHELLTALAEMMGKIDRTKNQLCGHMIKSFDIPFLIKRFIKHRIVVPLLINVTGLKPWEMGWILDTNEMWNVGTMNKTSLVTICECLGIPSPKGDIDGGEVGSVYWEQQDMDRIRKYCERDTVATMEVYYVIKELL
jgi:DNA polymerase elongation subunit (family B)